MENCPGKPFPGVAGHAPGGEEVQTERLSAPVAGTRGLLGGHTAVTFFRCTGAATFSPD